MKTIRIFSLGLLIWCCSAFTSHFAAFPETIDWHTHFKGMPDMGSPYAAITSTVWQYGYHATIKNGNLNIDFNFLAGVDPEKSWVKPEKIRDKDTSKQLLKHEQGHVYLNFLLLKNGENLLKNQNYSVQNYKYLVQKTAKQISNYYNRLQQQYDEETRHGTDMQAQKQWDSYFEAELRKL